MSENRYIFDRCELPLKFKPNRQRLAFLIFIGLVLDVICLFLLCRGISIASSLFGLLFFGSATITATMQLFQKFSRLELDGEGFTFVILGRAHRYRWQDVTSDFSTYKVRGSEMIAFDLDCSGKRGRRLNKALCGHTHAEPSTFEQPSREIAGLMTSLRKTVLSELPQSTQHPLE